MGSTARQATNRTVGVLEPLYGTAILKSPVQVTNSRCSWGLRRKNEMAPPYTWSGKSRASLLDVYTRPRANWFRKCRCARTSAARDGPGTFVPGKRPKRRQAVVRQPVNGNSPWEVGASKGAAPTPSSVLCRIGVLVVWQSVGFLLLSPRAIASFSP